MSNKVNILIVTVTKVESSAVLQAFEQATHVTAIPLTIEDLPYFDLGTIDNARIFLTLSEMGTGGLGGSLQTVSKGIEALSPIAVIMVGIAFGVNYRKQSIGDILVTEQLRLYDLQRRGTQDGQEQIILRGDKPHASSRLIKIFKSADLLWQGATVRFGTVLTGDKLIDNIDHRDQLLSIESEAIGGEMEGAGLYVACQDKKVDWILVKGICDWADGNKGQDKESRQLIAAQNAAAFVLHALQFAPLPGRRLPNKSYNCSSQMDNTEIDSVALGEQLKKYNNSQIDDIINELNVDDSHIRMSGATKSDKIIDLIGILKIQEGGLQLLQETLKKKMIPRS
jgi:nucleoside phosphorylase